MQNNELIEFEFCLKSALINNCGRINVQVYYNAIKACVEVIIHNTKISTGRDVTYFDALDQFLIDNQHVTWYFDTILPL